MIKVGDKVRYKSGERVTLGSNVVKKIVGDTALYEGGGWDVLSCLEVIEKPAPVQQALRFNDDKPKLSYLLTFDGAIEIAFDNSMWGDALELLATWYRLDTCDGSYFDDAIRALLGTLDDDEWPEQLAAVSAFGEKKYARGNYLNGHPWSAICDSLMRHIRALDRGETHDADSKLPHTGHIAWNVLQLQHCVATMPQFDDRIRAPKLKQEAA